MTTLQELKQLASDDTLWAKHMLGNQGETILQMIALIEQMAQLMEEERYAEASPWPSAGAAFTDLFSTHRKTK
jgi:hypothetical protein